MITSYKKPRHAAPTNRMSSVKKFTIVAVIGLAAAISVMSAASDGKTAYISDSGKMYTVAADSSDIKSVLAEAGISISNGDEVTVTEMSGESISIDIKRAFEVSINVDDDVKTVKVTGGTVAQALKKAEIDISANDFVTPSTGVTLTKDNAKIDISRGVKLYLEKPGTTELVYVPEGTVKDALDTVGCELSETGNEGIKQNTQVESGMTLRVDKVFYRTTVITETIEPEVVEEKSDLLSIGETSVKQEGREGKIETAFKEKFVNGELAEKTEDKKIVVQKPKDKIILVGTKNPAEKLPQQSTSADSDISSDSDTDSQAEEESVSENIDNTAVPYNSVISGICTAYYEVNGITATGTIPKVGTVAVNPNVIPYGTRLYIESADGSYVYGYAVAEDTGTACMAGDIIVDLYMNSEADCNAFGRQLLNIYILD